MLDMSGHDTDEDLDAAAKLLEERPKVIADMITFLVTGTWRPRSWDRARGPWVR